MYMYASEGHISVRNLKDLKKVAGRISILPGYITIALFVAILLLKKFQGKLQRSGQ